MMAPGAYLHRGSGEGRERWSPARLRANRPHRARTRPGRAWPAGGRRRPHRPAPGGAPWRAEQWARPAPATGVAHPAAMRAVLVYTGPGAGSRSVASAVDALTVALPGASVGTLNLAAAKTRSWHARAAALVMPGGADLPYARDLAGAGNASIRAFVEEGGAYLGLCAGAFFGASYLSFEPGTPLEVEGRRELAFFPGRALGAAAPGFDYGSESGAVAARLRWRRPGSDSWSGTALDYCNGGPVFVAADGGAVPDEGDGFSVLARYELPPPPPCSSPAAAAAAAGGVAAVACVVGAGVAVLCGTHPELAPVARWLPDAPALAAALDGDAGRVEWWGSLLDAARLSGLRERGAAC